MWAGELPEEYVIIWNPPSGVVFSRCVLDITRQIHDKPQSPPVPTSQIIGETGTCDMYLESASVLLTIPLTDIVRVELVWGSLAGTMCS